MSSGGASMVRIDIPSILRLIDSEGLNLDPDLMAAPLRKTLATGTLEELNELRDRFLDLAVMESKHIPSIRIDVGALRSLHFSDLAVEVHEAISARGQGDRQSSPDLNVSMGR